MKNAILILLGIMTVVCMGALTRTTLRMLAVPHWRVDANIAGANPDLGTASVSTYTGIVDGSLTLTNATGSGVLTAQIPCSSTNASSGTTCSVGTESVGVAFTIPADGCAVSGACDVRACVSFSHAVSNGASGDASTAFQIVETPNNAQTISQEGKSRLNSRALLGTFSFIHPLTVCGTFYFTTAGQKTLRLFYEQAIGGTVASSVITGDALASTGQRDIHWEVYPILAY